MHQVVTIETLACTELRGIIRLVDLVLKDE